MDRPSQPSTQRQERLHDRSTRLLTLTAALIPDLKAATSGYVVDNVEGFAVDANGEAFVATDNVGVDNSSGETLFLRLGRIDAVN